MDQHPDTWTAEGVSGARTGRPSFVRVARGDICVTHTRVPTKAKLATYRGTGIIGIPSPGFQRAGYFHAGIDVPNDTLTRLETVGPLPLAKHERL
jgi:hypothetical protein